MMPLAVFKFSWIYTGARGTLSSKGPLRGEVCTEGGATGKLVLQYRL
jgi:hypothetical protein